MLGTVSGNTGSGSLISTTVNGEDYYIIDGALDLVDRLAANGVAQNQNAAWSDACLSFAYSYCYWIINGSTNVSGSEAASDTHASYFTDKDDSKEVILSEIYNQISNGKACIIQVNGNSAGTSRHFVAVVGFKNTVTSADTLKEEDLLIIDPWDGQLESMSGKGSGTRFMITGQEDVNNNNWAGYVLFVYNR